MAGEDSNVSIGLEIEPVGGNVFNLLEQQADAFFQKMMGMSKVPIEIPLRVVPDTGSVEHAIGILQSEVGAKEISVDAYAYARTSSVDEAVGDEGLLQRKIYSNKSCIRYIRYFTSNLYCLFISRQSTSRSNKSTVYFSA